MKSLKFVHSCTKKSSENGLRPLQRLRNQKDLARMLSFQEIICVQLAGEETGESLTGRMVSRKEE